MNEWKREDNAFGLYVDSSSYKFWIDEGFVSYWKGYGFWKENQVMIGVSHIIKMELE